jgi:ABC-type glycerol-3-phosphate transport system substrate-binding protein
MTALRTATKAISRRTILGSGAASLSTGLLAACGAGQTPTQSAPAATKPTGTIEFWQGWATRTPQLRVYLDRFEQENPGAKVFDQEATTNLGGRAKMVANVVAGTVPDSLMVFKADYPIIVPTKALVGLNKYVSRDKIDLKQFGEGDVKERTFNGELVAMPSASGGSGSGMVVYWNKAHFREVGLNPEVGPKTWAELETFVTRLNRPGDRLGVNPTNRFLNWLYTNNGRVFDDTAKKVAFDSAEARDVLRYVSSLVQKQNNMEILEAGAGTAARALFYQGKHSMILESDLLPSVMAVDPVGKEVQWGVGLLPHNQANSRAKYTSPSRGGHGYAVMTGAKNPEGAWALAKFLTLSDAQCDFMVKEQSRVSTLKRCNTAPEVQRRPEFQVFNEVLKAIVSIPFTPGDDRAISAIHKHTTQAELGKISLDAAISAAVQEAQLELDEGWKTWPS